MLPLDRLVSPPLSAEAMPSKKNANGRHRIPKMRHALTNWAEYDAGLRRRGSLTLWVTDEAITAWAATRRATPGGQATYSDSAIQTCLMLRGAALRGAACGVQARAAPSRRADAVGGGIAGL
jgi:hypothetical protein